MGFDIKQLYRTRFGGTADTAAASALGLSGLFTSPFFSAHPLMPFVLSACGSAWIASRFSATWADSPILKSESGSNVRSDLELPSENDSDLMLGYDMRTGRPIRLPPDLAMRHIFVLGQSGTGKTVFLNWTMLQQMARGGGLCFIDGKMNSQDLLKIWQMCKWTNRELDLYVINPGNPDFSNTVNPILDGTPGQVASRILSIIPSSENNAGTDFYRQAALQGLTTLLSALKRAGLAYNFIDLAVLLINARAMEDLAQRLGTVAGNSEEARFFAIFLEQFRVALKPGQEAQLDMRRMKEQFGGIGQRMYLFGAGDFGKVLNSYSPDTRIAECMKQGKIVYVMLPTMGDNEQALNFAKILMGDVRSGIAELQALPEHEAPRHPFMIIPDEAGSYVNQSWSRPFEQGRSARVSIVPAAQTMANYETISPELREMILGNTWTKVFFKLGTPDSCEQAATIIGEESKLKRSVSVGTTDNSMVDFLRTAPDSKKTRGVSVSESYQETDDFKVSPGFIGGLAMGECLITVGGRNLYHAKVPYFKFDSQTAAAIGKPTLNRHRTQPTKGADFFKDADRYIST